ncbi:MAG: DNA polymerase Y family protein [Kiloniellaceae bacterium]
MGAIPRPANAEARPLALVAQERGRLVLAAVDAAAAAEGLGPGLPLAEARALAPDLETAPHDPAGDAAALARLAEWCGCYTPWAAVDAGGCQAGGGDAAGAAGILLDVTGCAHLFGGEDALLADLVHRVGRLGFAARAALAEGAGAAWALARFAEPGPRRWTVVPPGAAREALAPLPPAALRLPPATVELLERLGLRRVGDLLAVPPAALEPRFGPLLARRLAQALGREAEPILPRRPVPPHLVRQVFAEPIAAAEDIARGLERLLGALTRRLEADQRGARRLELGLYRVDGTLRRLCLGTSRASRDPAHLARLFAEHLDRIDPGFGVEVMTLAAPVTEDLSALQLTLAGTRAGAAGGLPALIDRLGSRLGLGNVVRPVPRESHIPERAAAAAPALEDAAGVWSGAQPWALRPRPVRLLPRPEPVEAVALLPDHPPVQFRWRRLRHRVVRAEGPERIAPEWWLDRAEAAAAPARDYFRVEDEAGRRYWLYRAAGRWFVHGMFA